MFDAGITVLSTCNFSAASGLALGPNVFLVGRGAANDNHDTDPPSPPAILMMTCATGPCAGDVAHIECLTYGGQCGAVNLTVKDDMTSLPFFLYTGGVPYLDNVTCWGKNNRTLGQQPVNDCVWLGDDPGPSHTMCRYPSEDTDSFCGYGNAHISIYAHNIRRAIAFGSNANGVEAYVWGDYSNANVDTDLHTLLGGFVEFNAALTNPSYGNSVVIIDEAAQHDSGTCNFKGSFHMVRAATNNVIRYVASDPGSDPEMYRCDYTGYIEDSSSGHNDITAQEGVGKLGEVYDSYFVAGGINNTIHDMVSRTTSVLSFNTGSIGTQIPLSTLRTDLTRLRGPRACQQARTY